ncbi:MAG: hypothetical protein WEB06_02025 [Actinomycetota bacterium]
MFADRSSPDDFDARFMEWRDWLEDGPIYKDVVNGILVIRQVWNGYRHVLKSAPPEAKQVATFHEWLNHNYGQAIAAAVRRQNELRENVHSLARLLDLASRFPRVLSRERFIRLRPSGSEQAEGERFDEINGVGYDFLDPTIPATDLEHMRARTEKVRTWFNKSVAHYDRKRDRFVDDMTFDELHAAADTVVDTYVRWREILCCSTMATQLGLNPWETIFRVPWAALKLTTPGS